MSFVDIRALHAKWTLGWALIKRILLYVIPIAKRRGSDQWLGHLALEDLRPTPQDAWSYVAGTSRCIGCGLCDAVVVDDEQPSMQVMAAARRPEDALIAEPWSGKLETLAVEIARVCPARVDVTGVARLLRENAAQLKEAAS